MKNKKGQSMVEFVIVISALMMSYTLFDQSQKAICYYNNLKEVDQKDCPNIKERAKEGIAKRIVDITFLINLPL